MPMQMCAQLLSVFGFVFVVVLWYNISMNGYRHTKTTISMVNYHLIFCPRYRRKIFNIPGVEERFKELAVQVCEEKGFNIIAMECDTDHVHIFVNATPQWSPADIVKAIKGRTSHPLREEFAELNKMPSLWTRSYFCSTAGEVSSETVKWYIQTQKRRA